MWSVWDKGSLYHLFQSPALRDVPEYSSNSLACVYLYTFRKWYMQSRVSVQLFALAGRVDRMQDQQQDRVRECLKSACLKRPRGAAMQFDVQHFGQRAQGQLSLCCGLPSPSWRCFLVIFAALTLLLPSKFLCRPILAPPPPFKILPSVADECFRCFRGRVQHQHEGSRWSPMPFPLACSLLQMFGPSLFQRRCGVCC